MTRLCSPQDLFKWTCPLCLLSIRTRHYDLTASEAAYHGESIHDMVLKPTPVRCMWDSRINGYTKLLTYDE